MFLKYKANNGYLRKQYREKYNAILKEEAIASLMLFKIG